MTIGERIRAARLSAGLTQADLARRLGVSRQAMYEMEKGRRHFKGADTLYEVARGLGMRMEDLMAKPTLTGQQ